jgi:hypothetical protein
VLLLRRQLRRLLVQHAPPLSLQRLPLPPQLLQPLCRLLLLLLQGQDGVQRMGAGAEAVTKPKWFRTVRTAV